MGIEIFDSIDSLSERITKDRSSNRLSDNRFPVRFIFLNSFEELKIVFEILSAKNVKIIDLGNLLLNENTWLTPEEIVNSVKELDEDAVFLPLSEYLRFQDENDFYGILKSLTEIEKDSKRIYLPLVGLWERFKSEFWNNFYRKKEWAPIWKFNSPSKKIQIFQINFDLIYQDISIKNTELISSTKAWFDLWKKENIEAIISYSNPLYYFYNHWLPDHTFDLEKISNTKEFIYKIFEIKIPIEFKEDEINFWNKLLEEVINLGEKRINFNEIFLKHFNFGNISQISSQELLFKYLKSNNQFDRWLIKYFIKSLDKSEHSYFYSCFETLEILTNKDLAEKLWMEIFNLPTNIENQDFFTERKILLKQLNEEFLFSPDENELQTKLSKIVEYPLKKQLKYLTNISFTERRLILNNSEIKTNKEMIFYLKDVYPELYYYSNWNLIQPDNEIPDWIIEYFSAYNYSKILDSKSIIIEDLINEKNKNVDDFSKWFFSVSKAKIKANYECVWVDGLGAEWFPLIVYFVNKFGEEKGKYIKKKMITRVNLPSSTECNKYPFDKIEDLDEYIHNYKPYENPDTLIEEIEIIKEIVKSILDIPKEKICILSDHGFSFLCSKKFGNIKSLDFKDSKHHGRYMWINETEFNDDEYYFVWKIDDGDCQGKRVLLALKHVSLNNVPYKEVHGGATPEELLVPFILIDTKEGEFEYKIEPISFKVSITKPIINVSIYPLPTIIEAFTKENSFDVLYDKKSNNHQINLKGINVGKHVVTLKIGKHEYELEVEIKGGFIEKDLMGGF